MKVLLIWMSVFIQRFFIVWCVLSLEKYATKKRDLGLLSKIDFGLGKCKKWSQSEHTNTEFFLCTKHEDNIDDPWVSIN